MSDNEKPSIVIREDHGGHGARGRRSVQYTCPWCGVLTTASPTTVTETQFEPWFAFLAVVCSDMGCGRAAMISVEFASKMEQVMARGTPTLYPPGRSVYAPQGVPETIARDFREAWDCYAAGFFYGAALVGRRVLQAGVRAIVGDNYNTLNQELNALPSNALNEHLRNATHEVRHIGNDAAHADDVTRESVLDLLEFTEDVLYALFVVPARVAASRERRERT